MRPSLKDCWFAVYRPTRRDCRDSIFFSRHRRLKKKFIRISGIASVPASVTRPSIILKHNNMAANPEEAVFSVSVIKEKGKQKTVLVKNAIKRIALKFKWEDLMDWVVASISKEDLPNKTLDKFPKLVTIDIIFSRQRRPH